MDREIQEIIDMLYRYKMDEWSPPVVALKKQGERILYLLNDVVPTMAKHIENRNDRIIELEADIKRLNEAMFLD